MQATRDFHTMSGISDRGCPYRPGGGGCQLRRLHVEDRARSFRASRRDAGACQPDRPPRGAGMEGGRARPSRFIDRLAELGYKAYPFEPVRAEALETEQASFLLRCLGVAAFAAMNIMMLSIPVWSGNVSDMIPEQRDFFHWLSALIACRLRPIRGSRSSGPCARCGRAAPIWTCRSRSASCWRSRCR